MIMTLLVCSKIHLECPKSPSGVRLFTECQGDVVLYYTLVDLVCTLNALGQRVVGPVRAQDSSQSEVTGKMLQRDAMVVVIVDTLERIQRHVQTRRGRLIGKLIHTFISSQRFAGATDTYPN